VNELSYSLLSLVISSHQSQVSLSLSVGHLYYLLEAQANTSVSTSSGNNYTVARNTSIMASTDPTDNSSSHSRRRSSFTVSELLAAHSATSTTDTSHSVRSTNPAMTSAVTQAAQQPHARRLSITTLGLSGSGGSASTADPVTGRAGRSNSILEAAGIRKGVNRHASISEHENESAVVDDMDTVSPPPGGGMGRRLSSGAKAYRDVRTTSAGNSMLPGFPGGQQSPNSTVKTRKHIMS